MAGVRGALDKASVRNPPTTVAGSAGTTPSSGRSQSAPYAPGRPRSESDRHFRRMGAQRIRDLRRGQHLARRACTGSLAPAGRNRARHVHAGRNHVDRHVGICRVDGAQDGFGVVNVRCSAQPGSRGTPLSPGDGSVRSLDSSGVSPGCGTLARAGWVRALSPIPLRRTRRAPIPAPDADRPARSPGLGADIGSPMPTDFGFIAHAAERHANEILRSSALAIDWPRDVLPTPGGRRNTGSVPDPSR